jgi:Flp pilus assembly protein TadB
VTDRTKHAGLGVGVVSLLAVVCCAGLPLLVAAGLSVAVLAWIGGIAGGAVALTAVIGLLALRSRQRRAAACDVPREKVRELV